MGLDAALALSLALCSEVTMRLSYLMSGFVVAGLISVPTSAIAQMPAGGVQEEISNSGETSTR